MFLLTLSLDCYGSHCQFKEFYDLPLFVYFMFVVGIWIAYCQDEYLVSELIEHRFPVLTEIFYSNTICEISWEPNIFQGFFRL